MPHCKRFDPAPAADITPVAMGVDEYEAIRLIDYEGLDQSACAARMEVARTTVTRIGVGIAYKVVDGVTYVMASMLLL